MKSISTNKTSPGPIKKIKIEQLCKKKEPQQAKAESQKQMHIFKKQEVIVKKEDEPMEEDEDSDEDDCCAKPCHKPLGTCQISH